MLNCKPLKLDFKEILMPTSKDTDLQQQQFDNERLIRENEALRSERLVRQTEQLNNQRLARENQVIREQSRARQAANNTSGFFAVILVFLVGLLGFGLFYFLGRSDTTAPQAQPPTEQPEGDSVLPDINVEVPSPPDVDINLPEINGNQGVTGDGQGEPQANPSQDGGEQSGAASENQGEAAQ